ncbi:MAG: hypothetical protein PHR82_07295 [Endomicrobiaceae bacterium]|nr:hypothetical protein [Endomicrobiaceae bacterium]
MSYNSNEELKSKYGRNNNTSKSNDSRQDAEKVNNPDLKQDKNSETKKTEFEYQEESAQNLIAQEIIQKEKDNKKIKEKKHETTLVKFLKIVVYIAIISTVLSIGIALIAKTNVNAESEAIIEQIKKAENLYFDATNRYCYFSKTNYNDTLGVDLSKRKYFMSYEVIPNIEFGSYEVKLYGATNAFTITYYAIKSFILSKTQ